MPNDGLPPTEYERITTEDVTDEGLMPGLFRELSRRVGITNELIEKKVIPAQNEQSVEINDLGEQVSSVITVVNEFDSRLYAFDRRISALEEINKTIAPAREAYPKLIERVTSLETITGGLQDGVTELRARPLPQRIKGVYLAAVFFVTLLASAGLAFALTH